MYARWLVVMLLLPAATPSDDLGDPQLHGLAGARWFYQLGCRMEEQSMFDESLRSLQTSVRLQQESLSGNMICGVVPAGRWFTSPDFVRMGQMLMAIQRPPPGRWIIFCSLFTTLRGR